MQSIQHPTPESATTNDANTNGGSRLRTVTGNRWPRKCSCGCGSQIPRDASIRYVVDFGAAKPYPTYLREHSPDFGTFRGGRPRTSPREELAAVPGFVPATALLARRLSPVVPPESASTETDIAHTEPDATATPESGRPWASGQLVFNAGQFESARSAFADYGRDGETAAQLRTRVNRVILEDLEERVIALRRLHERLRDPEAGESFGAVVGRSRPIAPEADRGR